MLLLMCAIITGVGLVAFNLGTRRLPPPSAPNPDFRLSEQDERIEVLELELQRLRDQADFTEKLLSERSGAEPEDALEGDAES
jgi:hypothetical protein